MGNGDRELLASDDGSSSTMNQLRRSLTTEEKNWIERLPSTVEADDILMFHASPGSDHTYFLEKLDDSGVRLKSPDILASELGGTTAAVVVCGHSCAAHSATA